MAEVDLPVVIPFLRLPGTPRIKAEMKEDSRRTSRLIGSWGGSLSLAA